ncbi:hypothetical protein EP1X_01485 [Thermococcus sp. EP1]|uniref:hypothetical protein n=1 Tax=Thermococcus sp. EP1 TaxID=1591054 RepID=UPI0006D9F477|nr:hypothetical protein [Thermococcus sp. EP1]KPU63891.1 hypothetical protein EP1X_01485 [Thermococcus sp. EP1]
MKGSLRKYIGLLVVGFIMAFGTTVSIALLFNDFLPIKSATDFLGVMLAFTLIYTELGYAIEFLLPMAKGAQN